MHERASLFELAVVAAIFVITTIGLLHLSRMVELRKQPIEHRHEMEQ